MSFPVGSSGGPDGLRPQHLKDILKSPTGSALPSNSISSFLSALTSFVSLVVNGGVPEVVRPLFFGARLTALSKKSGGVRPIAVGCTLRRLVAKVASGLVLGEMSSLLAPRQLGYGVPGGVEAAVHAARYFLQTLDSNSALLKLDFRNAFNSIRRDKMLSAVKDLAPTIFPYVLSCYSAPTSLFWEDYVIESREGVQQGDPLGPLLFCLAIHEITQGMKSEFCVLYLDDLSLGGDVDTLRDDLQTVHCLESLGLSLNTSKSEIIADNTTTYDILVSSLPNSHYVHPSSASLLGSPLGDLDCVSTSIHAKVSDLSVVGDRLQSLTAHDSIILLRYSFAIPKLMYILRTAPCFLSSVLGEYDQCLCSIVSNITNVSMSITDAAWHQASLPVWAGGLGFRSAVQLAPSAFLASATAATPIFQSILHCSTIVIPGIDSALSHWSSGISAVLPCGDDACLQRAWDSPHIDSTLRSLAF